MWMRFLRNLVHTGRPIRCGKSSMSVHCLLSLRPRCVFFHGASPGGNLAVFAAAKLRDFRRESALCEPSLTVPSTCKT
ncbi:hypothetical protein GDO78_013068 [Eleutherodactylus coqui]|uniref:Uncharacterized protein n=1 Tax=Eleutherodactylus coqui TaxID=57060 RepID=A0A8J6F0B9_ELECQ|nr:hypothetical protein GDO78_013068 [Eleutherodactylus coqui]